MGTQAVKGVEIGDGFALAGLRGSEAHDEILRDEGGYRRETNHAGGLEAGVSNGEEIVVRAAMKPLPTLMRPLRSADLETGEPPRRSSSVRTSPRWRRSRSSPRHASLSRSRARRGRSSAAIGRGLRRRMAGVRGADPLCEVGALGKHLALIGFMGAGKSTVGREVAERMARPFVDTDAEIERLHGPIPELFERGEPEFRRLEEQIVAEALAGPPSVIALGGGRGALREDAGAAARARLRGARRGRRGGRRGSGSRARTVRSPETRTTFGALFAERPGVYAGAADAAAADAESTLLAALGIQAGKSALEPPRQAPFAVVADEHVLTLHDPPVGGRRAPVPGRRGAKAQGVVEGLWAELELGRDGTLVAFGGGSTTDVAGFAAATYLRGIDWIAVPTTLLGQVDAAIGGKTGIDTACGKNLAGAFHFPRAVVQLDPAISPRFRTRSGGRAWRRW